MKSIGEIMFDMINMKSALKHINSFKTLDEKRQVIDYMMTTTFDEFAPTLTLADIQCNSKKCSNLYENTDLFHLED